MKAYSRNLPRRQAILFPCLLWLMASAPCKTMADSLVTITEPSTYGDFTPVVPNSSLFEPFRGTFVTDPGGYFSLVTITCRIHRDCDGMYWDGSSWGNTPVDLSTDVNNDFLAITGFWQCTAGLPPKQAIAEGTYTLTAHASGFSGGDGAAFLTIDFTRPTVSINGPADNSASQTFPRVYGRAADGAGRDACGQAAPPSGVASVALSIFRFGDGLTWDGSQWRNDDALAGEESSVEVPVDQSNGTWSYILPFGAGAADDLYYLHVRCFDRTGNNWADADSRLWVDAQPPALPAFTFPAGGATVPGLPGISGIASDNAGGSGIDYVFVTLERASDNTFWNGSGWTRETFFPAVVALAATPPGNSQRVNWAADQVWPAAAALVNGTYRARAYAIDLAGNTTSATNTFTVNKQVPTVDITFPANGGAFSSFPSIYGTATAAPGLNVARVDLYMYKESWLAYWDGTIWDDQSTTVLHTTMTSATNWAYYGTLPTGTNAADDTYSLIVYAYDNAGNFTPLVNYLSIDTTNPPPPVIDSPTNGAALQALRYIRGTGSDNRGGSGLNGVLLFLSRNSDGKYWTGSGWDVYSFASILFGSSSGTNWILNYGLPAGTDLLEDRYSIVARAFDWAGNYSDIASNGILVDLTAPTATFLTPRDSAPITSLPFVAGHASDPGGSGVSRVDLAVQRSSDGLFWDGTNWSVSFSAMPTVLEGTNWSIYSGLPAGDQLKEGVYAFTAYVYDRAGNVGEVRRTAILKRWPLGCSGSTTSFGQNPALPILDFTTNVSTLVVSNLGTYLWDVDLRTFITHTYNADLIIKLTSPAGTTTTLASRLGGSFENVFNGTTWDDQSGLAVTEVVFADNVVQPRLVPEGAMGAFVGENPNGVWTLTVSDLALGDTGHLASWSLALTTFPAAPTIHVIAFTNSTAVVLPGPSTNASTLAVNGTGDALQYLALTTLLTDSVSSDMAFELTSPAGTVTTISSHYGGGNSNVLNGTVWDDRADTPVALAAFTNGVTRTPLIPVGALAAFNGEDPNGLWTLTLADIGAGGSGRLNGWSVVVTTCSCPPIITDQPRSQTVVEGSNVTFTIAASGALPLSYQWQFGGSNLPGATNSTFTKLNVQPADAGDYMVAVTNFAGAISSAAATLTVEVPPSISIQPRNQTVAEGSNFTFTVTASGTAPLSYQWWFGGAVLSGATTSAYTKVNAHPADAGDYIVAVTNVAGAITSAAARLTVSTAVPTPLRLVLDQSLGFTSFRVLGSATEGIIVQVSTNLTLWTPLWTNPNPSGAVDFLDSNAVQRVQGFYRLAPWP